MSNFLLSRLGCYLSGHDYTIRQSGGRVFLYCLSCEHTSDGIALNARDDVQRRAPRSAAGSPQARPSSHVLRPENVRR